VDSTSRHDGFGLPALSRTACHAPHFEETNVKLVVAALKRATRKTCLCRRGATDAVTRRQAHEHFLTGLIDAIAAAEQARKLAPPGSAHYYALRDRHAELKRLLVCLDAIANALP
jgi:hypothetical protein